MGFGDERDAAGRPGSEWRLTERLGANPFSAGPRLARATATEDQPRAPIVTWRRQLVVPRPDLPIVKEFLEAAMVDLTQRRRQFLRRPSGSYCEV
jgi:hypothetical protein